MREISVVMNARLQSSRLPNKVVLPFAGTTLLDIALSKLKSLPVKNKFLAAKEPEILEIYSKYSDEVQLLDRTDASIGVGSETMPSHRVVFSHYEQIPTDYIMSINACLPFVQTSTFARAIEYFQEHDELQSMTSVFKSTNVFFDELLRPINLVHGNNASTLWNKEVYEMAHAFHVFNRHYFMDEGTLWDYSPDHPGFFEVRKEECLDIDYPIDFRMCECLYRSDFDTHLSETE